jgi:hypothetical protein
MNRGCVWIILILINTARRILRAPTHPPSRRLHGWLRLALLPQLLLGLSSYSSQGGPDQNGVHHPLWSIRLHHNIIWVEERRSHLSTGHPTVPCGLATPQH